MRINTEVVAVNARQLNINGITDKPVEKSSLGQRINGTINDAGGLSNSEKMRSQIRGLSKVSSNAQDGISLAQVAENALEEYAGILHRIRELAVRGANEAVNTRDDYTEISATVEALNLELNRIIDTTRFNGRNLFNGDMEGINLFDTDSNGGGVFANDINLPDMTITPPDYEITDADTADAMMDAMDDAISSINGMRSNLNAMQNRLESTLRNLNTILENLSSSQSRIRDMGTAKGAVSFTMSNILSQASETMLAQANQSPQSVLQLLR